MKRENIQNCQDCGSVYHNAGSDLCIVGNPENVVCLIDEEAEGGPRIIQRFSCIQQAEAAIAEMKKSNPAKVYRGGFGIDAPEDMLNPK